MRHMVIPKFNYKQIPSIQSRLTAGREGPHTNPLLGQWSWSCQMTPSAQGCHVLQHPHLPQPEDPQRFNSTPKRQQCADFSGRRSEPGRDGSPSACQGAGGLHSPGSELMNLQEGKWCPLASSGTWARLQGGWLLFDIFSLKARKGSVFGIYIFTSGEGGARRG